MSTVLEVIEQNGISIGEKRGEKREKGTVIKTMLESDIEIAQIAKLTKTTIEYVLEVKRKM